VKNGVRKLTKQEVPDSSLLLWASDVHIPVHAKRECSLMIECAEREGVTHNVPGGDILDLHCLSTHDKEPDRILEHGTLLKEVEPGRWLLDWFASRPCYWLEGNHETRLTRYIAKNGLPLHGSMAGQLPTLIGAPQSIEWIPDSVELRLGNLVLSHGHKEFGKSTGGAHPAAKLLQMYPDQSTIVGHLHRLLSARRTSRDEDGIRRTRAAFVMPHMSVEESHYSYVPKSPNWQVGFGLIRVFWEGSRPRFNVTQIEILYDRNNRPYFEHNGKVYR